MAKVAVPRKGVTPNELVAVLGRRLGTPYTIERDDDGRVTIRKGPLASACVSITSSPGASVFRVRAGGPPVLKIATGWITTRRVVDALRRSPEFRSL
jgi:hypothetical protein